MDSTKRIRELLEDLFAGGALKDCFVIDIVQGKSHNWTIYFDSDSGVSFEKCTQVSRFLERAIDAQNILPADYTLDVSSPGVDRPLLFWRQYPRHKGRILKVTLKDGSSVEGRLAEVEMDSLTLKVDDQQVLIAFAEIEKSFVQISF